MLADEINRTPPKTQAALLEAMQEHSVTVQGRTYHLDEPFFVFATQNPIELEGTYPLPEAQLDRFTFEILLDYLSEDEELGVVTATTSDEKPNLESVITGEQLLAYQRLVRRMPTAPSVARYALQIVRATRPGTTEDDFVKAYLLMVQAFERPSSWCCLRKQALTRGATHVGYEDVRALVRPVLRHRLLKSFKAESEGVSTDDVIEHVVGSVTEPKGDA